MGYLILGHCKMALNDYDGAISEFRKAYELDDLEIEAYRGMVIAMLASNKQKMALTVGRESLKNMPRNSMSLTLVGLVLSQQKSGLIKAEKAFKKALASNPRTYDAVCGLCDL